MNPYYEHNGIIVYCGDCQGVLSQMPDESVNCVVTSPPYWGLRDYGVDGQLGLEKTPEEYTDKMVEIFREVGRVLRNDGTLWINLGSSYASGDMSANQFHHERHVPAYDIDGWYLRSDIIWSKPNPMPESVTDRPTKSHEYLFLLSKSAKYYYDTDAIKEPANIDNFRDCPTFRKETSPGSGPDTGFMNGRYYTNRNKRIVWTISTQPFPEAHLATFPEKLIEPCIKAGCPEGGMVLDPFGGSGTTAMVARRLGCRAILIDLKPEYCGMAIKRSQQAWLF